VSLKSATGLPIMTSVCPASNGDQAIAIRQGIGGLVRQALLEAAAAARRDWRAKGWGLWYSREACCDAPARRAGTARFVQQHCFQWH